MSPGRKKQGASCKTGQKGRAEDNKDSNFTVISTKPDKKSSETKEDDSKDVEIVDKKYQKRKIVSNLLQYEEPIVDTHADVSRGDDYEVLLSYSGGAGSQHRFKDEKEWEDNAGDSKDPTIDFNHLVESLKCIPFYKRHHLATELFEPVQISKMDRASEQAAHLFSCQFESQTPLEKQNVSNPAEQLELPFSDDLMFQIEKNHPAVNKDVFQPQAPIIEPETKKLAESLTSFLTLNSQGKDEAKSFSKPEVSEMDVKDDNLDFLLSLSSQRSGEDIGTKTGVIGANIDEWLNSILDE